MMPRPGYVYCISDDYFKDVNDPYLMQNKGSGRGRPCYCCKKSESTGLYWMIPLSTQWNKFRETYNRNVSRYGKCINLVLGHFAGKETAFVIQNAFPVTENYVVKIFTKQQEPIPVQCNLQRSIYRKFQQCLSIHKNGHNIFYTDVDKAKRIMLQKLR